MKRIVLAALLGLSFGVPAARVLAEDAVMPESPVIDNAGKGGTTDGTTDAGGTTDTGAGGTTESKLDEEASRPGGAAKVTEKLAAQFGVETEQIQSLRDEGLGYGEIKHALSLAETMPGGITDDNVAHILDLRQEQHMGWGKIAQEVDVKLGDVTGKGHAPESPVISGGGAAGVTQQGGAQDAVLGFDADGEAHGHGPAGGGYSGGDHGVTGFGGGSSGSHGNSASAPGHNR